MIDNAQYKKDVEPIRNFAVKLFMILESAGCLIVFAIFIQILLIIAYLDQVKVRISEID